MALRKFKDAAGKNDDVIVALADAANNDKAWGVRATAADSLGQIGGAAAAKKLFEALNSAKEPWLRARIVAALGNFTDDVEVAAKLRSVADNDSSYRARAAALQALGKVKASDALATLQAEINGDSPDDFLRNAALRSLGALGDDEAVPLLREWAVPGKKIPTRTAAISSLADLQKDNKEITKQLASYLTEPQFPIRIAAVYALGARAEHVRDSGAGSAAEKQRLGH